MPGEVLFELRNQDGVITGDEARVDEVLERVNAHAFEPCRGSLGPPLTAEFGEGRPVPESERTRQSLNALIDRLDGGRVVDSLDEAQRIHRGSVDVRDVAAGAAADDVGRERFAQLMY